MGSVLGFKVMVKLKSLIGGNPGSSVGKTYENYERIGWEFSWGVVISVTASIENIWHPFLMHFLTFTAEMNCRDTSL